MHLSGTALHVGMSIKIARERDVAVNDLQSPVVVNAHTQAATLNATQTGQLTIQL